MIVGNVTTTNYPQTTTELLHISSILKPDSTQWQQKHTMTNHQLLQARIAVLLEIILCQYNTQLFCIVPGLRSENESACYTQSASAAHSSASLGQHLALLSASKSWHNEYITVRGSHNSRSQDQMPYC